MENDIINVCLGLYVFKSEVNISYSSIFLHQEIKMAEAMTYTGIHTFFLPSSFFLNNCMIQPFQLISVSYHVFHRAQLGCMHVLMVLSTTLYHWLQICHFLFHQFTVTSRCLSRPCLQSILCLSACWMMLLSMK